MNIFGVKTNVRMMNHPTHSIFPARIRFSAEESDVLYKYKYNHNYNFYDKNSLDFYSDLQCYGPNKIYLLAAHIHNGYNIEIEPEEDYQVMMQSFVVTDDTTGEIVEEYVDNIDIPSDPCVLIAYYLLNRQQDKAINVANKYIWYEKFANPYPRVNRSFIDKIKNLTLDDINKFFVTTKTSE